MLITAGVLVASACGSDIADNRTGIQDIDQILDTVESADAEQIEALVSFGQRTCDRPEPGEPSFPSHGGIMCRDGEPTDMLVDTFWSGSCEGSWWYRADIEDLSVISTRVLEWDIDLYAVYEVQATELLSQDHVAVYSRNDDGTTRAIGIVILKGAIVGLDEDCGLPPAEMVELSRLTDPILLVEQVSAPDS